MTNSEKALALVTGASDGIGLELARQFGEHGYDLLICAEDAGLERAAAELREGSRPACTARWPNRSPDPQPYRRLTVSR